MKKITMFVLLEIGYVTNLEDARLLRSAKKAAGIAKGIEAFLK
ncbi:hypothetical protein ACFDTO_25125 [Microbacteriaceae bacterium 4G12]